MSLLVDDNPTLEPIDPEPIKKYALFMQYRGSKVICIRYDNNFGFCQSVAQFCVELGAHYRIVQQIFTLEQAQAFAQSMNTLLGYGYSFFDVGSDARWCRATLLETFDNSLEAYVEHVASLNATNIAQKTKSLTSRDNALRSQIFPDKSSQRQLLLKTLMSEYNLFLDWCHNIKLEHIFHQLYPTLPIIIFAHFYIDLVCIAANDSMQTSEEARAFFQTFYSVFENTICKQSNSDIYFIVNQVQYCNMPSLVQENETCQRLLKKQKRICVTQETIDYLKYAIGMDQIPKLVVAKMRAHVEFFVHA